MTVLSKFILEQRKKHKWTQEFLAETLEISRPTYMQIEQGDRELTISEARKLAKVFDISFEDFLRGKESLKPKVEIEKKKKSTRKPETEEIRISIPQVKMDKFHQVLLYILKKAGGKPGVGMASLYHFLYFIDFDYYEKNEDQLMGLEYHKKPLAPTPIVFEDLILDMEEFEEVEIIKSKFYKFPQIKYLVNPEVEPDLSVLNGNEQEHIDWELQRLSDLTEVQLSNLLKKDVPWISAEEGKTLDYESVFYRTSETSVRDYDDTDEDQL